MDDVKTYLRRLSASRPATPDLDALGSLHERHILRIPSSNANVHQRERRLDAGSILPLITTPVRDGLYAPTTGVELNVAFCWLLNELGFHARLAASTRTSLRQEPRPVVLVDLDRTWLADVGTAFGFRRPLALEGGGEIADVCGVHRLRTEGDAVVYARSNAGAWNDIARVRVEERRPEEFLPALEEEVRLVASEGPWGEEAEIGTETGWEHLTRRGKRLISRTRGERHEMQLLGFMIREQFEGTFGIAC